MLENKYPIPDIKITKALTLSNLETKPPIICAFAVVKCTISGLKSLRALYILKKAIKSLKGFNETELNPQLT